MSPEGLPDETGTMPPGALAAGSVIAAYRIVGKLGSGGMGEVYRATDSKLHRDAALKVLAPEFAQNAEWLSRFEREARVLASINHPHIAAIYGLEESGGIRAIAMELVEGPTLAERIKQKRIPVKDALAIARQIAEALEYAHEKGIVHRDLKPANVKVTPEGAVKVLDFGLAKAAGIAGHGPAPLDETRPGMIVGTPAYMAPEQAAGTPVDRRADIWAFGVVLFEMLTGRKLYGRKTMLETLAAVARDEPPWGELPQETPAAIVKLLRRCLDKDPKRRLQAIGEARIALEEDRPEEVVRPSNLRARTGWIAVAGLLGLAAAAGWVAFLRAGAGAPGADWMLSIVPPPGTELPSVGSNYQATPEISPDGTMLVCRLGEGLQLRKLNSTQFIPLPGTTDAVQPFWAPDSQWIGFFVNGALMKMQVPDGAPELLWKAKGNFAGGTWGVNGILFSFGGSLLAMPANPGNATPLPLPKPLFYAFFPHFLPDGEHFLFFSLLPPGEGASPEGNFYLGAWSGGKWSLPPVPIVANSGETRYSSTYSGAILFVRGDNLYAQKLNIARARLEGGPILVETSVAAGVGVPHTAGFSVSANGVLAWRPGRVYAEQLTWFDRHGKALETAGPPTDYMIAIPSPDERRIAAIALTDIGTETRVLETGQSGFLTILDPEKHPNTFLGVVWRRDGLHLLSTWGTWRKIEGKFLAEQSATGSSEARDLGRIPSPLKDMTPDGTLLMTIDGTLHVGPLEGDRTGQPLLASNERTSQGAFSPDGHWVVYASEPSKELFVQSFPISGPPKQISAGAGFMPYWRADGKEIVYLGPDSSIYSVRLDPARMEFHPPERLFAVRSATNSTGHSTLAVSRDGARILFNQAIDQPESRVINVVALRR